MTEQPTDIPECFVSFSGFRDAESHRFSNLSANWSQEGLVKTQIAGLPLLRSGFSTSGAEPEISHRFPGMLALSSTEHHLVHPGLVFIEETEAQRSQQVAQSHTARKWQSEDV